MLLHAHAPHSCKQSLVRIPETLMCAMEFITLYTPPDHNAPLEELRKVVAPFYGELMARSNKAFWQRKVRRGSAAQRHRQHSCLHSALMWYVCCLTLCAGE